MRVNPSMIHFCGYIYYPHDSLFSRVISPVAQVSIFLERIYEIILQAVWKELISKEKEESEIVNLVLFLLFCGLSLVFFYLQAYRYLILGLGFTLWFVDRAIAQRYYYNPKNKSPIKMQLGTDQLYLEKSLPQGKVISLEFNRDQIKECAIAPKTLYSDAFRSELGLIWQVILYLQDDTEIVIHEEKRPEKALVKAKHIASILKIPIRVFPSEGNHPYATDQLCFSNNSDLKLIAVKQSHQKWHIYSQWQFQDTFNLLKEVISETGFVLFVIIFTGFMIQFGSLLKSLMDVFVGEQPVVIDLSALSLRLDIEGYFELLIGVGIIFFEGIRISQTKHLSIEASEIKYSLNRKREGHLKTKTIEAILFIPHPEPMVLILGETKSLAIFDLPSENAYREMVQTIESIINHLESKGLLSS